MEKGIAMEIISDKSNGIAIEFSPHRKGISAVGRLCEAPQRFTEPPYRAVPVGLHWHCV
jgi:hypothetical protein